MVHLVHPWATPRGADHLVGNSWVTWLEGLTGDVDTAYLLYSYSYNYVYMCVYIPILVDGDSLY